MKKQAAWHNLLKIMRFFSADLTNPLINLCSKRATSSAFHTTFWIFLTLDHFTLSDPMSKHITQRLDKLAIFTSVMWCFMSSKFIFYSLSVFRRDPWLDPRLRGDDSVTRWVGSVTRWVDSLPYSLVCD